MTSNDSVGDILKRLGSGFVTLAKVAPCGSLQARKQANGAVFFYWRYSIGAKSHRELIGQYESSLPPRSLSPIDDLYSYNAAVRAAEALAVGHHANRGKGGRPALLAAEAAAKKSALQAQLAKKEHTLGKLCDAYVDWQVKQGKMRAKAVRSYLAKYVPEGLREVPAREVTVEQIVEEVLRPITEVGHRTTARHVRACLRAAFQCAVDARSDPELPKAFKDFGITMNPVASVKAISARAARNPLPLSDLRKWWNALKKEPAERGAALRLHVLTGAQRLEMLLRLQDTDVCGTESLRLVDYKGRGGLMRDHYVPQTPRIRAELRKLPKKGFLFSTTSGEKPMHPTSLDHWAKAIASRAGLPGFQLKRVRSAVETELAKVRILPHVRGRLQSHGISGVQALHYDAHRYLDEKAEALKALLDLLEPKAARKNVVPIESKRKRA